MANAFKFKVGEFVLSHRIGLRPPFYGRVVRCFRSGTNKALYDIIDGEGCPWSREESELS